MVPQGGELFLKNENSLQFKGRRQRKDTDNDTKTIFDIDEFIAR